MKLTGYTPKEVDVLVDQFSVLMQKEMTTACSLAADHFEMSTHSVVADGHPTFFTLDGLSVIVTQWSKAVTATLMPFLSKIFMDAGQRVTTPLGDVSPIKTTTALESMENIVTSFSADMWDQAKQQLIIGSHDGESIATLASRVAGVADIKAKKAHVIAQTSVIAAVNGGEWQQMMEAAKAFNMVTYKEWVSTHDSHTRPTHEAADGQQQPLASSFVIGGGLLQYPGDPGGPPEEVISCRCTTVFDVDVAEQITASQTSPETLSSSPAVVDNSQNLLAAITAAFNSDEHPRGKNGRFIKKGVGLPTDSFYFLVALKKGDQWSDFPSSEKQSILDSLKKISAVQWANIKDEDKTVITNAVGDAVDEGVPGSANAQVHLDDLDLVQNNNEDDLFDPNTPLPEDEEKKVVKNEIDMAYFAGEITDLEHKTLLAFLNEDNAPPATILMTLDKIKKDPNQPLDPSAVDEPELALTPTKADIDKQLNEIYISGKLTSEDATVIAQMMENGDFAGVQAKIDAMKVANASAPSITPSTPLTTGSSTPVKITHGLIHAKHAPGTVIAQSTSSDHGDITKVTWNGSEYDVTLTTGDTGKTQTLKTVKKSKLYAYLNEPQHKNKKWVSTGKQETEVSHATPLDAAPPANPVPHPTTGATVSPWPSTPGLANDNDDPFVDEDDDPSALPSTTPDPAVLMGMVKTSTVGKTLAVGERKGSGDKFKLTVATDPATGKKFAQILAEDPGNKGQFDPQAKIYNADDLKAYFKNHAITGTYWKDGDAFDGSFSVDISGPLPTGNKDEILESLAKIFQKEGEEWFGSLDDYKGVKNAVKNGDTFVGKTVVHSWNTQNNHVPITVMTEVNTPNVPAHVTLSTPTAESLTGSQKYGFYAHFKAEKVSPAWSAAKIYKSMHAAKAKSTTTDVKSMSDAELLKVLDEIEVAGKSNSVTLTPYSAKVKDWLKTPNGQKAFKELNPAIPTPTPTSSSSSSSTAPTIDPWYAANPAANPAKKTVAKKMPAKKAFAKKTSSTSSTSSLTPSEALGDTTVDALANTGALYTSFKGSSYGKYLSDKPEAIYWNAVQQAKSAAHLTPGAILANVDAEGAKKFGVPDEKKFLTKVMEWLNTPSGKKKAAEIKAGTWSPASSGSGSASSYGSSGFGASYAYPADTPLEDKIPSLQQVEPYDPTKSYNWKKDSPDFPVLNDKRAKQMVDTWSAQQGAMTTTQKSALRKYTGSNFHPMNSYLRGYNGASEQTHKDVQSAQEGMRLSLEPMVLHRGNGWFAGWNSVAEVKSHLGEDFHQEAFFSASITGKSAFSGSINFVIECPPGTPMAYVDTFSQHPSENEMLLGGNLTYKVLEVIEGNNAPDGSAHFNTKVTVRLRVVPPVQS